MRVRADVRSTYFSFSIFFFFLEDQSLSDMLFILLFSALMHALRTILAQENDARFAVAVFMGFWIF